MSSRNKSVQQYLTREDSESVVIKVLPYLDENGKIKGEALNKRILRIR